MSLKKGALMTGVLAMIMTAALSFAAMADTGISRVNLTFTGATPKKGNSVGTISCKVPDNADYYISECYYTNGSGSWEAGDVPGVFVEIVADDGYYFKSENKGYFSISGMSAKFDEAELISDEVIELYVVLPEIKSSSSSTSASTKAQNGYLDFTGSVWWDGKTAHWGTVKGAIKYELELRKNGSSLGTLKTMNHSVNFSTEMSKRGNGTYSFRVRGIYGQYYGTWSEWSSGHTYGSGSSSSSYRGSGSGGPGSVRQNEAGWLQDNIGWWFKYPDGSYPAGRWELIGGKWYCFDSNGYMRTGWIGWNGAYYYCDPNTGAMLSNTWTPDGFWVDPDGSWNRAKGTR